MDTPREMRIAAHSGSAIRPVSQVIEHTGLRSCMRMGIQNGGDIALKGIGFSMGAPQMMFILTHVPGERSGGIGMPKQFADVRRCHAHLAHPGGGGGSCSMRGNAPNHISLTDPCELAEEG